jgi:hypothetical protein
LFDVDVRVNKDKVIRIEVTDKDDVWQIAYQLQSDHNLDNALTAQLFVMLKQNYETSLAQRQQLAVTSRTALNQSVISEEQSEDADNESVQGDVHDL